MLFFLVKGTVGQDSNSNSALFGAFLASSIKVELLHILVFWVGLKKTNFCILHKEEGQTEHLNLEMPQAMYL